MITLADYLVFFDDPFICYGMVSTIVIRMFVYIVPLPYELFLAFVEASSSKPDDIHKEN